MKWEKVKLGDICKYVTSGGTPKSSIKEYYEPKQIPWLKTKEVNYCRIYETESYISKDGLDNSSAKMIPQNSVIVAMYGQGDTAGRVAINKIPLTTNQACCNLIIDETKAYYEFVYYQLVATVYKGNIIKNLIMDCQSYTKYRPNETTGGIFVSWRRKEELPTGA